MSEEKEKRYELDINGDKLILEEKVFNLLLNIWISFDIWINFSLTVFNSAFKLSISCLDDFLL